MQHLSSEEVLGKYGIEPHRLVLKDVLSGEGAFGVVRRGLLNSSDGRRTEKEVAVKQLPLAGATPGEIRLIIGEVVALARASESCKYACRLLGLCRKDEHFCIVMKKYDGSLHNKLNTFADRCAPLHEVERWIAEICRAMAELHAEGIVLRDLKPSNVLLDDFGGIVLADFGISHFAEQTISSNRTTRANVAGTLQYMAPEAYDSDELGRPSTPSDIWSLGCTIVELLLGITLGETLQCRFTTRGSSDCSGRDGEVGARPHTIAERVGSLADVLQQCFRFAPAERPTAQEVHKAVHAEVHLRAAIGKLTAPSRVSTAIQTDVPTSADDKVRASADNLFGHDTAKPRTTAEALAFLRNLRDDRVYTHGTVRVQRSVSDALLEVKALHQDRNERKQAQAIEYLKTNCYRMGNLRSLQKEENERLEKQNRMLDDARKHYRAEAQSFKKYKNWRGGTA